MASETCSQCGAAPGAGSVGGLCPRCLVRVVRATRANADAAGDATAAARQTLGEYELLEEIDHGGMGVVWRARQISLNRVVALKLILTGRFASESELKRFRVESEAAAHLDHPNIVPIYQVGEHEGQPYFAMKFIEGGSLARRIPNDELRMSNETAVAAGSKFDIRNSALVISKVARAVHHAHQRGLLHRDLKPANILLDAQGEPHVTDFGLAKRFEDDGRLTMSGAVLGTPNYMSPEAAAGNAKQLTTATDIYSVGAILYELLAGRPPFQADTPLATMRQVMDEEPERPSILNLRVDRDLETICLKCLEKDPQRRYSSAAELADDLERWMRDEPILARRCTSAERLVKSARRHPVHAAGITTLLLVLAAGVSGILWQWRRAEHETERVREAAAREAAALLRNEAAKDAFLEQARAFRTSMQMGQRIKALGALAAAARIRPSIEMRNEALAALALPDLVEEGPGIRLVDATYNAGADADVRVAVYTDAREGLRLHNLADGHMLTNWSMAGRFPGWLTFSPNGNWLSSRNWDQAVFWNLASQQTSRSFKTRFEQKIHHGMEFSPDSRHWAVADGGVTISLVNVESGELVKKLEADAPVSAFTFSPDGRHLAVSAGRSLQLWNLAEGAVVQRIPMPAVTWLSWHADGGRVVAVGGDDVLRIVELPSGEVWSVAGETARIAGRAVLQPGGTLMATGNSMAELRLWDLATGRLWFKVPDLQFYHFSRDGKRLACFKSPPTGNLIAASVIEGSELRSFIGPTNVMLDLDASPDGRWLAGACDDGVRLWKLACGQQVDFAPLTNVATIEFSGDSQSLLVQSGDDRLRVPLLMKERRYYSPMVLGSPVIFAQSDTMEASRRRGRSAHRASSPLAGLAAQIIFGHRIRLTDLRTGEILADLTPPDDSGLTQVFFSRDGQRVVTVNEGHIVQVWDLPRLRTELAKLNLDWGVTNSPTLPIVPRTLIIPKNLVLPVHPVRRMQLAGPLGVPSRDHSATSNQIDLTSFYNATLTDSLHGWREGNDLSALPAGLKNLAGVTFDVRGLVHLGSTSGAHREFPKQVAGIPVGRRCRLLHFLQAASAIMPDGTLIGTMSAHYADETQAELPIRYGEHVRDWHWVTNPPIEPREASGSVVAWRGANGASRANGSELRLFKTTWTNSQPSVELRSLDYVSKMTKSAPFLIAITAE